MWVVPGVNGGGFHAPIVGIQRTDSGAGVPNQYGRKFGGKTYGPDRSSGQTIEQWFDNADRAAFGEDFLERLLSSIDRQTLFNVDEANQRWSMIRSKASAGCFRGEPVELRHMIPAAAKDYMKMDIVVLNHVDKATFDPSIGEELVDVDYYRTNLMNPKQEGDQSRWRKRHWPKKDLSKPVRTFRNRISWGTEFGLEKWSPSQALRIMTRLNQVPFR